MTYPVDAAEDWCTDGMRWKSIHSTVFLIYRFKDARNGIAQAFTYFTLQQPRLKPQLNSKMWPNTDLEAKEKIVPSQYTCM